MDEVALKPCPFCGSTNIHHDRCTKRTRCKDCFATGPFISKFMKDDHDEDKAAIIAWNTRAEIKHG